MTTPRPRYLAYMLRLWQIKLNGEAIWRASLESPQTGKRQGFADPCELLQFLAAEMGECGLFMEKTENIRMPESDLEGDANDDKVGRI